MRGRLYERYISTHVAAGAGRRGLSAAVVRHHVLPGLPPERCSRILDVGCGSGELLGALASLGYTRLAGIDISPEQAARARARGVQEVVCGDLHEHLRSTAGRYDAIVALDVLEHFQVDELLPLLDLVLAALRPEGPRALVVRVPNATSPFAGRYRYGDLTHCSSFTTRSLRQLLSVTGFRDVGFRAVDPVPHGLRHTTRWVVWQGLAGAMKLALAAETGDVRGHIVTQNVMVYARG